MCCSMMHCVAVCGLFHPVEKVLQPFDALPCCVLHCHYLLRTRCCSVLQCVAVCCSVLHMSTSICMYIYRNAYISLSLSHCMPCSLYLYMCAYKYMHIYYIYVYIYIYIYMCTYIHRYTCFSKYMYTYMYLYTCKYVCIYIYI